MLLFLNANSKFSLFSKIGFVTKLFLFLQKIISKKINAMRFVLTLFLLLSVTCLTAQKYAEKVTTIVFVRHAEKAKDGTEDPPLTDAGTVRAVQLGYALRSDSISAVFSTNYERTRKTALPTANFHDLTVELYENKDLYQFLEDVVERYRGQKILIVGHSNSVPKMLNILLKKEKYKNIEDYVYNDLFIAQVRELGDATVLHLNYGEMSEKPLAYNVNENKVGVQGYDVVAYHLEQKAVEGNPYISTTYEGVTYFFSSQTHLNLFVKEQKKYLPEYGGWCAYGMAMRDNNTYKQGKYDIDPQLFKIINGKLYLFHRNNKHNFLELWSNASDVSNIKRADEFFLKNN